MSTTTPAPQIQPATDAPPLPWVNQPESVLTDDQNDAQTIGLVYLSALVRWLMKAKNLHFVPAVLALHKALTGREDVVLYVANKAGQARAVGPEHSFDPYAGERHRRRMSNPGLRLNEHGEYTNAYSRNSEPALPLVPTGQAAALVYVGKVWGNGANPESVMDYNNYASMLAMTCSQAAEIWGVEDVSAVVVELHPVPEAEKEPSAAFELTREFIALCEWRKTVKPNRYSDEQVVILYNQRLQLYNKHGKTGVTKFLSKKFGNSVTAFNCLADRGGDVYVKNNKKPLFQVAQTLTNKGKGC